MESTWEYCVTKPLDCWLFSGLSRKLNTSQTVSSVCVLHVLPLSYSTLKFQTLGHLGLKYLISAQTYLADASWLPIRWITQFATATWGIDAGCLRFSGENTVRNENVFGSFPARLQTTSRTIWHKKTVFTIAPCHLQHLVLWQLSWLSHGCVHSGDGRKLAFV